MIVREAADVVGAGLMATSGLAVVDPSALPRWTVAAFVSLPPKAAAGSSKYG